MPPFRTIHVLRLLMLLGLCWLILRPAPFASSPVATAAMVSYSAAGANAAALQTTIDQYRAVLGGGTVPGANGSFGGMRREINWDGVPNGFAAPNNMPANFFNINSPRGAIFSTPGSGLQVSATASNPTATPVRFDNINPTYSTIFTTFSPQRLFTPLGSNVVDVAFFVPGTTTPATVKGFGAVFADVDTTGMTKIELFDQDNKSLGAFAPPAANGGLSFLGVAFTSGERVGRIRITAGNSAAGPNDGGAIDVVVIDDLIYSEPQPPEAQIVGLTSGNKLVRFSSLTPGTIASSVAIAGLQSGESVLGIDFRPATGQLYALGSTSHLYRLDPATGVATLVSAGAFVPALSGAAFGLDVNPVVDRIRVVSDTGQNIRLNPNTGVAAGVDTQLAYAASDVHAGQPPSIVGAAYTNNIAGATVTTLYDIDSNLDILVIQNPPNAGVLNTIGALGVDTSNTVGFDTAAQSETAFAALTVGSASQLYTLNLTSGAATLVGAIGGPDTIRGIAIMPVRMVYMPFIQR